MMKEIAAIIRSGQWQATIKALNEAGLYAMTRQRAYGRGKQKGLRYGNEENGEAGISLLPKWVLTLVVEDVQVEAAVAAIIKSNQSGEIGDGKIFVCPIANAVRIRTDEKDLLALR